MNYDEIFVPYDIASLAKEKGYPQAGQRFGDYVQYDGSQPWLNVFQDSNEESDANFTIEASAPLYWEVIAWLRKNKIRVIELPTVDTWVICTHVDGESKGAYPLNEAIIKALNFLP